MNILQASIMTNAIERVYSYVAGDLGYWVDSNGTQTRVRFLWYDSGGPGLTIDDAGMQNHEARDALWKLRDVNRLNITVDPTGYLLDNNGERWDFMERAAIQEATVPIMGIHNMIGLRFRKATELNSETRNSTEESPSIKGDIVFEE